MLNSLGKISDRLIGLSAIIGALGLLFEVALIVSDVIGRNFDAPLAGAHDLSTMAMVILVFGGMAYCDKSGGHISVDIFEGFFSAKQNLWIDAASALIGALIFAAIAWTVFDSSKISQMLNLATNVIYLPKAWFQWCLSIFAAITSLAMALRAINIALSINDQDFSTQDLKDTEPKT